MHWTQYAPAPGDPLRASIHAEIEQASGRSWSVSDPLFDELIATVQALQPEGCTLNGLLIWIWDNDRGEWTAAGFARWFRAFNAVREGFRAMRTEAGR